MGLRSFIDKKLFLLLITFCASDIFGMKDLYLEQLQDRSDHAKNQLTCLSAIKNVIKKEDNGLVNPFYTVEDLHKSLKQELSSEKNVQMSKELLSSFEKGQFFYDLLKCVCPCFSIHGEKKYNCDWNKFNYKNNELKNKIKKFKKLIEATKEVRSKECRSAAVYQYQTQMALYKPLDKSSQLMQRKKVEFKTSDKYVDFDESA